MNLLALSIALAAPQAPGAAIEHPGLALPAPIDQIAISPFERRADADTATVAIREASLRVDVYPGVVGIRGHVSLRGQTFGRWVGLPLSQPDTLPLLPPRNLEITVDEAPVEWEVLTRWTCQEEEGVRIVLDDDACAGTATPGHWATFFLPETRTQHASIRWSAWQLVDRPGATVRVLHGTGGTWAGPIDILRTEVHFHGVDAEDVDETVRVKIPRPNSGVAVDYAVDEPQLSDRQLQPAWTRTQLRVGGEAGLAAAVLRFVRDPDPPEESDWDDFVHRLQKEAVSEHEPMRLQARGLLADLQRWVADRCEETSCSEADRAHAMDLFTPHGATGPSSPLPVGQSTTLDDRRATEERFRLQVRRVWLEELEVQDWPDAGIPSLVELQWGRPPSLADRLLASWMWIAGGVLILGVAGLVWLRRRSGPSA